MSSRLYLSEFVGMFVFALMVLVIGGIITNSGKRNNFYLALGAGAALAIGVMVALSLGGNGILNPALTVAGASRKDYSVQTAFYFIALQVAAAVLAYFAYRYVAPYVTNTNGSGSTSTGTTNAVVA